MTMTPWSDGRRPGRSLALALFITAANAVPGRAQEPAGPTLTLEQAIEAALRHSPQIAQATGAVRNAESAERTAWGAFLPNLSVNTGASRSSSERFNPQTNTTVTGSSNSYSAGLSSSIDIFTGGRRGAELTRSRAQTAASEAALVEQRFSVILSAKRAFFEVLRGDELVRVAEASVQRAQEGIDAAERRMQVGSATRSDVLRARLELTNAKQAVLQAQNQRRTAAFALGRLVGIEGPVGARIEEPLAPRPLALSREELTSLVLAQAPAVRSAAANAEAAEASVRAARGQYFPSITASAGYDLFNTEPTFDNSRKSWTLRLGVSYPIFNRFQREDAVSRANVQADVARVQLDDARRLARAELERILANLELAEERVAIAEEAVSVAEEDLRVQQERYRLGVATILDLTTSQANLVQAEVNRIAARYDYQIARAELEALVGREL
jgi:TolC family type I secretion outer membrane protein